jgi:putative endonuclease
VTGTLWIEIQVWAMRRLDALARRREQRHEVEHIQTGEEGEREALFHLRKLGYIIVAQRWKTPKLLGDVDLIGWDGDQLCFIEVKTRSGRAVASAESAVDRDKQQMLRRMARSYVKRFPWRLRDSVTVRFDVVSVYLVPSDVEFNLYRGAFGW